MTPDLRGADVASTGPLCPDPEALAAWIDQGLGEAERARVAAHLAGCDECRVLLASVIETRDAVGDVQVGVRVASDAPGVASVSRADHPATTARSRRLLMRWSVGVLATAAALLMVVRVQPPWWPLGSSTSADSRLADLADAVGQERTVEARLTGGFRHGLLRAPVRSGGSSAPTDNWSLLGAAGRIRENAEQDPSAPNLHALGLAHLVLSRYDDAVLALEDAIAEDPQNARYQSDLAAAYLARAKQLDRPDDLPRALGAAERAISGDPQLLEPLFNRALALQALFLEEQARRAWSDYLSRDPSSSWAEEARRHLAELQRGGLQIIDPADNSPPAVSDATVEAGLDWLLRRGLPAWAEAVLSGDAVRASRTQSTLTDHAQQISQASSDPFAASLVVLPSFGQPLAASHAEAVRGFAEGLKHLDADALPRAEEAFASACGTLSGGLSVLCDLEQGAIDVLRRRDDSAARRSSRVLSRGRDTASPYLEARAHTLEGYRAVFKSSYASAAEHYQQAADLCQRARYRACAGNAAAQLSELLELSGAPVDGWRMRLTSLEAAAVTRAPKLSYMANVSAAWSLGRRGDYHASRSFLVAADAFGPGSRGLQRVPSMLGEARAALASGDHAAAQRAVQDLMAVLDDSDDMRAERIRADVLALRGAVALADGDNQAALDDLTAALQRMGPERALQKADALLTRAVVHAETGSQSDFAEEDLNSALNLMETQGMASAAGQVPGDFIPSRAVAAVVAANPALQNIRGLSLAERFKEATDKVPIARRLTGADTIEAATRGFDGTTPVIFFLSSEDHLLVWVLNRDGVTFSTRRVSRRSLERLTASLSLQIERTPQNEALWKGTLQTLYDELLLGLPGVEHATTLTIVPDGPLNRVPFSALIDSRNGRFLFERTSVIVAPNLAYAFDRSPLASGGSSILVVGAPLLADGARNGFAPLPRAREEALTIAAGYPGATALIGKDATRANVLRELEDADVFHFSGHAVIPPGGGRPRLLLSGSMTDPSTGLDPAAPEFRIKRGAQVILAGCETGATPNDRTTGISSVAAGFLRAGARSVVGTLWSLDDTVAEEFFVLVHAQMRTGRSPAAAVAAAQRACQSSVTCRPTIGTWIGTVVYSATN